MYLLFVVVYCEEINIIINEECSDVGFSNWCHRHVLFIAPPAQGVQTMELSPGFLRLREHLVHLAEFPLG